MFRIKVWLHKMVVIKKIEKQLVHTQKVRRKQLTLNMHKDCYTLVKDKIWKTW